MSVAECGWLSALAWRFPIRWPTRCSVLLRTARRSCLCRLGSIPSAAKTASHHEASVDRAPEFDILSCRSRYAGVGKRVRDHLEVKITHEVPAERQLIRQAGTMHLGWIWTGNLRSLLTGPGWSTACGEPAVKQRSRK